jgi:hypothetical protein
LAHTSNIGLAVLFDGDGQEQYRGGGHGNAEAKGDYHPLERAGGNFAFLIDLGRKEDKFDQGLKNGSEVERGWKGGFFIDR